MNITVKAAHCFMSKYEYQLLIRNSLIKHVDKVRYSFAIRVLWDPDDAPTRDIENIESIKNDTLLRDCWDDGVRLRYTSPSATFRVEPSQTIGFLKSLLESEPWTPKENLVLVQHKERPLDDDNCTLSECGFNGKGGSLLVCMDGSFSLAITDHRIFQRFDIPVSSCFETLGVLKEKINHVTGSPPEKFEIDYNEAPIRKKDNTRLVALGMVRPYSTSDMPKNLNKVDLFHELDPEELEKVGWLVR